MTCMRKMLLGWVAVCISSLTLAADPPLPPDGKDIFLSDQFVVAGDLALLVNRMVDVQGPGFTKALEATPQPGLASEYAVQYVAVAQQPLKKGDVLHIRLYGRCTRSMTGSAQLAIVYELHHEPWDKSLESQHTVGSEWTLIDLPFVLDRDYAAGESKVAIRLGYPGQTIQLGGIQVLNYGQNFNKSLLPVTRASYAGREADAPWRKAAEQRIDQLRKADLQVIVKDTAGQFIPGAKVHVQMTRHEFLWGTAVASYRMLGNSSDDIRYRDTLKQYFNHAVLENDLKWDHIAGQGYAPVDKQLAWLKANGISVRGHNLIWPGLQFLPKQAKDLLGRPDDLRKACDAHIAETASRYTGQLVDWDVINEPLANHAIQDVLGKQEMVRWFKLAKTADPHATLYINDYEILASGNRIDTSHQDDYYNLIKYLLDNGAPVEGIGMQGHFGSNITAPDNLMRILDRFATFKLPIKVTELDMQIYDEQLRADYMRDLLTVLFSHPSVVGVLQWGFSAQAHWKPETAIIDWGWNLRPHGKVFVDLVHKQWKTDVELTTDASGVARVRGFKGDYEITATDAKSKAIEKARLTTGGASVTCILGK